MKLDRSGLICERCCLPIGLRLTSACVVVAALSGAAFAEDRRAVERVDEGHARPHVWIRDNAASPKVTAPRSGPSGFWPVDMQSAYGISPNGGQGATVAIVDA